jgi:predicted peptidase
LSSAASAGVVDYLYGGKIALYQVKYEELLAVLLWAAQHEMPYLAARLMQYLIIHSNEDQVIPGCQEIMILQALLETTLDAARNTFSAVDQSLKSKNYIDKERKYAISEYLRNSIDIIEKILGI